MKRTRERSVGRRDPALYLDSSTHSDRLIAMIAYKRYGCRCDNCCRIRREEAARYRNSRPPAATTEQRLRWNLMHKYGLAIADYQAMVAAQGGACLICERMPPEKSRLFVDHNHATGKVRGLLCGPCNTYLGRIQDSPAAVARMLAYLKGAEPA